LSAVSTLGPIHFINRICHWRSIFK